MTEDPTLLTAAQSLDPDTVTNMMVKTVMTYANELVHVPKPHRAQVLAAVIETAMERASGGATPRETLEIIYNAIGDGIMECVMILDHLAEAPPAGTA